MITDSILSKSVLCQWSMVTHALNPSAWRLGQKDREFKATLAFVLRQFKQPAASPLKEKGGTTSDLASSLWGLAPKTSLNPFILP